MHYKVEVYDLEVDQRKPSLGLWKKDWSPDSTTEQWGGYGP